MKFSSYARQLAAVAQDMQIPISCKTYQNLHILSVHAPGLRMVRVVRRVSSSPLELLACEGAVAHRVLKGGHDGRAAAARHAGLLFRMYIQKGPCANR